MIDETNVPPKVEEAAPQPSEAKPPVARRVLAGLATKTAAKLESFAGACGVAMEAAGKDPAACRVLGDAAAELRGAAAALRKPVPEAEVKPVPKADAKPAPPSESPAPPAPEPK